MFTHFKLLLTVCVIHSEQINSDGKFVPLSELENYPFSTLMKKVFPLLRRMKNPRRNISAGIFLWSAALLAFSKFFQNISTIFKELFILIRGLAVLNSSAGLECFKPFLTAVNSQLLFFGAVCFIYAHRILISLFFDLVSCRGFVVFEPHSCNQQTILRASSGI